MTKIAMISLGCSKNLINSEQMLWRLREAGFAPQSEPDGCAVVIVNTCGFIESAKEEAIDQILALGRLKNEGRVGKLLVAGCLAERYRDEVMREMPEVDGLVGCGAFSQIVEAVRDVLTDASPLFFESPASDPLDTPRLVSTHPASVYLKVAEGCDNRCAYCVIPSLRGPYRSRPRESILAEARALVKNGARELILVAQDVTRYGLDLYGELALPALLRALCALEGLRWIRLHYLYPELITDELIQTVAEEPKIVNYLDIPIQHIDDGLLRAMNRRGTGGEIRALFQKLRAAIPHLVLRTSLIAGLPGETEAAFLSLCGFLRESRIERAGVFPYSAEEGTPAARLPGQVPEEEKIRRRDLLMGIQQENLDAFSSSLVGQTLWVLVEGYDRETGRWFGRSYADSPEVDGRVWLGSSLPARPGAFVRVRVTGVLDGDPMGQRIVILNKGFSIPPV